MATSMPVEEVLEREPQDCGADSQPQAVEAALATCSNNVGSFVCVCRQGYAGTGTDTCNIEVPIGIVLSERRFFTETQ
eukprot:726899-Rhodomonas_salina.1